MFDLGRSFLASTERSPDATAVIDGDIRLTYAGWMDRVLRIVGAFDDLGIERGGCVATALQNTWEMATIHWA